MSVIAVKGKRPPARARAAGPVEGTGSALERRVFEIEAGGAAGLEAVRFQISHMLMLFQPLLSERRVRRSPRSGFRYAPAPPGGAARHADRKRKAINSRDKTNDLPCRTPAHRRAALSMALDGEVRRLCERSVGSPARNGNSPGYYAVYFTDDGGGFEVEYVPVQSPGGGS